MLFKLMTLGFYLSHYMNEIEIDGLNYEKKSMDRY